MTRLVLDASVALAWVADRNADPYAGIIQRKLRGGDRAVLPALFQLEIANMLAMVQRRAVLTQQEAEQALAYLEAFIANLAEIDGSFLSARTAFVLAQELGLTAYDAVYVELAKREGIPLATLDKKLREAAEHAGITLV